MMLLLFSQHLWGAGNEAGSEKLIDQNKIISIEEHKQWRDDDLLRAYLVLGALDRFLEVLDENAEAFPEFLEAFQKYLTLHREDWGPLWGDWGPIAQLTLRGILEGYGWNETIIVRALPEPYTNEEVVAQLQYICSALDELHTRIQPDIKTIPAKLMLLRRTMADHKDRVRFNELMYKGISQLEGLQKSIVDLRCELQNAFEQSDACSSCLLKLLRTSTEWHFLPILRRLGVYSDAKGACPLASMHGGLWASIYQMLNTPGLLQSKLSVCLDNSLENLQGFDATLLDAIHTTYYLVIDDRKSALLSFFKELTSAHEIDEDFDMGSLSAEAQDAFRHCSMLILEDQKPPEHNKELYVYRFKVCLFFKALCTLLIDYSLQCSLADLGNDSTSIWRRSFFEDVIKILENYKLHTYSIEFVPFLEEANLSARAAREFIIAMLRCLSTHDEVKMISEDEIYRLIKCYASEHWSGLQKTMIEQLRTDAARDNISDLKAFRLYLFSLGVISLADLDLGVEEFAQVGSQIREYLTQLEDVSSQYQSTTKWLLIAEDSRAALFKRLQSYMIAIQLEEGVHILVENHEDMGYSPVATQYWQNTGYLPVAAQYWQHLRGHVSQTAERTHSRFSSDDDESSEEDTDGTDDNTSSDEDRADLQTRRAYLIGSNFGAGRTTRFVSDDNESSEEGTDDNISLDEDENAANITISQLPPPRFNSVTIQAMALHLASLNLQ